ncbi:MAG: hypothetical protein R3F30_14340 [Planctomycetota bacterium]
MRMPTPALLTVLVGLALQSCLPEPAPSEPLRLIEPTLPEARAVPPSADASRVRLRSVTARTHLRQPLLHQEVDGTLWEDERWLWTVSPADYLAEVLEDRLAAEPAAVTVDRDPDLDVEVELHMFQVIDSESGPGFVVSAKVRVAGKHGRQRIGTVTAGLPRERALPGDLARVAGEALDQVGRGIVAFVLEGGDRG